MLMLKLLTINTNVHRVWAGQNFETVSGKPEGIVEQEDVKGGRFTLPASSIRYLHSERSDTTYTRPQSDHQVPFPSSDLSNSCVSLSRDEKCYDPNTGPMHDALGSRSWVPVMKLVRQSSRRSRLSRYSCG